ncbi:hypothetical protein Dimus_022263 [Dionaea muscipula]
MDEYSVNGLELCYFAESVIFGASDFGVGFLSGDYMKIKGIDASKRNLELREKQILVLLQRLCPKEMVKIQNILSKHRTLLDAKMEEFELHLQQKKSIVDEEFRTKYHAVERKEIEIRHLEAKF